MTQLLPLTEPCAAIQIDPEFKAIIPGLPAHELELLAESITREGRAFDALKVWRGRGILLDGHTRYEICTRLDLPFDTEEIGDDGWTRSDAIIWIIRNQFGRRNITTLDRIELAARLEKEIEALARDNQRRAGGDKRLRPLVLNLAEAPAEQDPLPAAEDQPDPPKPIRTRKEAAAEAGVSEETYRKGKVVNAKATPKAKAAIKSGTSSIDREYKKLVKDQVDLERAERHDAILATLPARTDRFEVIHSSVADLAIPDGSVDAVITDPPYSAEFLSVYPELAVTAQRVLRDGGSCFVMIGQSYLPTIVAALSEHLTYHWTLAYLTPGGQATQVFPRKVNTFWKPVLWFTKGTYTGDWLGDVAKSEPNDNDKRFHRWGQSESGMADLIGRCSEPGQTVLDPFCGAGTTGVVAVDLGRRFIGSDIDAHCVASTICRLNEGG